jgi:amino-acid N-acetyltransferase
MISSLMPDAVTEPAVAADYLTVRKAIMSDIPPLLDLINDYAVKGIMLPRTEFELSENMRDFSVVSYKTDLIGCGALHFYSPTIGEIRSLAVAESAKTRGVGRLLIEHLVREAAEYSLAAVFAFTYVPEFFAKVGFHEVERGELPLKAWKDCLHCPKFRSCDEIAVVRILNAERWEAHHNPQVPTTSLFQFEGDTVVLLPTVKRPA